MRWRKPLILICVLLVAVLAAIFAGSWPSAPRLDARVVSVTEMGATKRVRVEVRGTETFSTFRAPVQMHVKVAGHWQPLGQLPGFTDDDYVLHGTNSHRLEFEFPRETVACRLVFRCQSLGSPYCRALSFLHRIGVSPRYPELSRAILKFVPRQSQLRPAACDFVIPAETSGSNRT